MVERTMIAHTLNCDRDLFDQVAAGEKSYEVRLADRNYQVGDRLDLRRAGPIELRELRAISRKQARQIESGGFGALSSVDQERLDQLVGCKRLALTVLSITRLSGAIVPPRPHYWKPSDAMQHGVVVMGIELAQ